ncbi:MAG: hypothetical protein EA402_01905 [Planctomycetota bacterium]|nr:MAG: hypothetical protein EA402_01905 [Planctomycetota bacterium]
MMLRPSPLPLPLTPSGALSQGPWAVVCGDVHLRVGEVSAFTAFLDRLLLAPPQHLIILGDLFDYWLDNQSFTRSYESLFVQLHRLHASGVHLHLVLGNRELVAGPHLQAAAPWRVLRRRLDIECQGRRLRIVHGDRLVRDPGYRFFASVLESWWFRAWQACAPFALHQRIARLLRAGSQRKGRRNAEIGPPLRLLDPRRVEAAGRGVQSLIAGHIHQQWHHRIRGIDCHLCGHWEATEGRWLELSTDGGVQFCQGTFPGLSADVEV